MLPTTNKINKFKRNYGLFSNLLENRENVGYQICMASFLCESSIVTMKFKG